MKTDPIVPILCNSCKDVIEAPLTPLAGNCFDERGVDAELRRSGWIVVDDDTHYCCEDCERNAKGEKKERTRKQ